MSRNLQPQEGKKQYFKPGLYLWFGSSQSIGRILSEPALQGRDEVRTTSFTKLENRNYISFLNYIPDLNPKISTHVKVDKITIVQRICSQVELVIFFSQKNETEIFSFSYRSKSRVKSKNKHNSNNSNSNNEVDISNE